VQKKIWKDKASIRLAIDDIFHSWIYHNKSVGVKQSIFKLPKMIHNGWALPLPGALAKLPSQEKANMSTMRLMKRNQGLNNTHLML
jgi:hypothetical protein